MRSLICCLALLLAACQNPGELLLEPEPASETLLLPAKTWVFQCAGQPPIVAQTEAGQVAVWLPEAGFQRLPKVASLAGNHYQNGQLKLVVEANSATVVDQHSRYTECQLDRRAAIWESAKLRGVQFRAVGNEPGWHLELNPSLGELLLVTQYGQQQQIIPLPPVQTDKGARQARYQAVTKDGEIDLLIKGLPCTDSMSGESFESQVTLRVNGQILQGCGRALY